MNVLDLFSGIGGFSLGLERAGMRTVAFCEKDERCRQVLQKHWPLVPSYDDVCTLTGDRLRADGIASDVICGGFPCQDISSAGKQGGIRAERSGLWSEYARIIGEVRPRYVIVENVSNLLSGPSEQPGEWFGVILGDLAALGFDAEWHCIPASAVGARHRRDRVWIVANDAERGWSNWRAPDTSGSKSIRRPQVSDRGLRVDVSDTQRLNGGSRRQGRSNPSSSGECQPERSFQIVAHAAGERRGEARQHRERSEEWSAGRSPLLADAECGRLQGRDVECTWPTAIIAAAIGRDCGGRELGETWRVEPDVGRVAHGVPDGMDRLAELGNAVVPQIPEIIGRAIMMQAQPIQASSL